jgi:predicted N-acetyltransferase YhbS
MRRELADGFELDDDSDRVDIDAVHAFISGESYWAPGRPRALVERLVREAARVVGLYKDGAQVGFARAATDGANVVYLADVYVLAEHRGRGLGLELVREMVDNGPLAGKTGCCTRATCIRSTRSSASGRRVSGSWSGRPSPRT